MERQAMTGKYHYTDGWYFMRLECGAVRIWNKNLGVDLEIDLCSWVLIIASMCAKGESADTVEKANTFHAFGQ